jgi:acyl-CoA synthetase (AMP-forming)/AMP-acid ligase II
MSEATLSICSRPTAGILEGRAKDVPGSAGILVPGMEARVLREDGSDADLNEPGELWVKGGNIALGCWNNVKASRETFVHGWLKTGDRFLVDADGYLCVFQCG